MSVGTWADLEEELRATGHTLHPRAHGYEVRRHGERVAVLADDLSALRSTVARVRRALRASILVKTHPDDERLAMTYYAEHNDAR